MTTYRDSGDYTWQDGNGPQPEPAAAEDNGATVRLGLARRTLRSAHHPGTL